MRITIRFLLLLFPVLTAVVVAFVVTMSHLERKWVHADLNTRSHLIVDSIQDSILDAMSSGRLKTLNKLLNRISNDSKLMGVVVCSNQGTILSLSDITPKGVKCEDSKTLSQSSPGFFSMDGYEFHRAVYPLVGEDNQTNGYVVILHDPSYMAQRGKVTKQFAITAFLILGIIISILTLFVYRWSVSQPLNQLSQTIKSVLLGDFSKLSKSFEKTEFAPLVRNLDKVIHQLRRAKTLTQENFGTNWSSERLRHEVQRLFGNSKLCVIANREPYIHNRKGKSIDVQFPASGLVSALEPIVRACSGLWIGHGSGSADRETADKNGIILVPPGTPEYALKRVWLTRDEEQGYYYGLSNEGLWPLCHIAHTRPSFRSTDWSHYVSVNQKFAQAFAEEMKAKKPIALIQDYHFALLPGILRKMRPDAITSLFWHIPWPNSEAIGICPWKEDLLLGMLGADLIGFHTQYHCNNFLDTVDRFLEARVDRSNFSVTIQGHTCRVKPFPISVEWPSKNEVAADQIPEVRSQLLDELSIHSNAIVGIGVDRVDYTKGIVERFLAVERMFELHPEMIGKFVFIQIGAPSRTHIRRYQDLNSEVQEVTDRINWKYRRPGYEPIVLRLAHHDATQVFRYYRSADVCVVSSLHDGMNLVAKEYISSRIDLSGALVLSNFTGAAEELKDAWIVNPYDTDQMAQSIYKAVTMSPKEKRDRMLRMRNIVASNNVYSWASQLLNEIHSISEQQRILATGTN